MKNNKFLIIESILSFFIIIIISAIITLVCLKIKSESKIVNNTSKGSVIITNILENMNSRKYAEIEEYIDNLSVIGISKKIEENNQVITVDGNLFEDRFFGTEIPKGYILELKIHNLNEKFDIQKSVNILLISNVEKLEISTVLERKFVEECNPPQISKEYFSDLEINMDNYEIIPIKYSNSLNTYVVTTQGDDLWYNYYAKEWAKILVFPKNGENIKNQFVDNQGVIKNTFELQKYMYTWIPNFSVRDNISYFRYGSGKNLIRQDLLYSNGEYLYLNTISDDIPDISNECSFNGINGVWKKVNDTDDVYFTAFNVTKFGPINLH